MSLIIACLSQKGGVGKSTLARLIARTYASAGWTVKICDFNTKQLTSAKWVELRLAAGIEPKIAVESCTSVKGFSAQPFDLLVVDGRPDSDLTSLEIARIADLCVIPTGLTLDDLHPQVLFANELRTKGVSRDKMLLVLNRITPNVNAVREARAYLHSAGFTVAEAELTAMHSYQAAQNIGLSIAETRVTSLNERADRLASEIVAKVNIIQEAA